MTGQNLQLCIEDPAAMRFLGGILGARLRPGDLLLLNGPLGAGKTTLTRAIGQALKVGGTVQSPTFVLARRHPAGDAGVALTHVDAYRLGGLEELLDLDLDFDGTAVVAEWAEDLQRVRDTWLSIQFDRALQETAADVQTGKNPAANWGSEQDSPRALRITWRGARWQPVIQELAAQTTLTRDDAHKNTRHAPQPEPPAEPQAMPAQSPEPIQPEQHIPVTVQSADAALPQNELWIAFDTSITSSVAASFAGTVWQAESADPRGHTEAIDTLLLAVLTAAANAAAAASPQALTQDSPASSQETEHPHPPIATAKTHAKTHLENLPPASRVVCGLGPGLYTGLRIGIAAAASYALGCAAKLLPVKSHDARALELLEAGTQPPLAIRHDARRGEQFYSEYSALQNGLPVCCGGPELRATENTKNHPVAAAPVNVHAASLLTLAARLQKTGHAFPAATPLYLRAPDAAQPKPPKRVST